MIIIPTLTEPSVKKLVKSWLWLAIAALAAAGIFALPPVILRGPFFAGILPVEEIFSTSLVLHVDLSVLVWMLSMAGMVWSYFAVRGAAWLYRMIFYTALAGMVCITVSPFFGDPAPLKNNYVPMLQNLAFILGLALFASGIFMQAAITVLQWQKVRLSLLHLAGFCMALITLAALAGFLYAAWLIPSFQELGAHDFYELLFWGGGHILQFTFTTLLLVAWMWLSRASGYTISHRAWAAIFILNALVAVPAPLIYAASPFIDDATVSFTRHMIDFGGLAPFFGGVLVVAAFLMRQEKKNTSFLPHYLWLSLILFGYGGMLGHLISGVNASIPAHYHGSIVGITLALIGLALHLLPEYGARAIPKKLALAQCWIYGLGQASHITGLAWMGGYGALRKAPGTSESIHTTGGKLLFFAGGGMAILGGLLFIVLALYALRRKR